MNIKLSILISILFALADVEVIHAQNFSGHYIIQSEDLISGNGYANAIAKDIKVMQTKDSMKIQRITVENTGDDTSFQVLALNGNTTIRTTISHRKNIASILFNKDSTIITYTYSYRDKPEEIEVKNREVWTVNDSGILTIIKYWVSPTMGDWIIKATFIKAD